MNYKGSLKPRTDPSKTAGKKTDNSIWKLPNPASTAQSPQVLRTAEQEHKEPAEQANRGAK